MIDTREPVLVLSDHANLRYFMTSQHLSNRQARWAAYLTSFHFVIRHISGKKNPADPPTQRPNYVPEGKESEISPCLLMSNAGDLLIQPSPMDKEDGRLDIGEVVLRPTDDSQNPMQVTDVDFVFCPPSKEALSLLQSAYCEEPPNPETIEGLEY